MFKAMGNAGLSKFRIKKAMFTIKVICNQILALRISSAWFLKTWPNEYSIFSLFDLTPITINFNSQFVLQIQRYYERNVKNVN